LTAELAALGAGVTVTDIGAAAALPGLTGVVHTADLGGATGIDDLEAGDLAAMTARAVDSARQLDELLADRPLDLFVTFTSVAGVWGGGGQAAAGAVSAALDALVHRRRARGLAATSVAWGVIDGIGIAADPAAQEQLRRRGLLALGPDRAMRELEAAIRHGDPAIAVADVDWSAFLPAFTSARPSPLLGDLPAARKAAEAAAARAEDEVLAGSQLTRSLARADAGEQLRLLTRLVQERSADVLGHTGTGEIRPGRQFQELGFDSLAAVALRTALSTATGATLPATMIFDYPTPAALAAFLRDRLVVPEPAGAAEEAGPEGLRRIIAAGQDDDDRELDRVDEMSVDHLVRRALGSRS
jgi:acyl carrier protein